MTISDLRETRVFAKSELLDVRRELSVKLPSAFLA
jgi:hypothetical protein